MGQEWSSDFSYGYFKKILEAAKSNFEFCLFSEVAEIVATPDKPKLFLRHDVDIDLGKALKMAKIERESGVNSTYMVLLNSPTYNIQEKSSRAILQELISMGT